MALADGSRRDVILDRISIHATIMVARTANHSFTLTTQTALGPLFILLHHATLNWRLDIFKKCRPVSECCSSTVAKESTTKL